MIHEKSRHFLFFKYLSTRRAPMVPYQLERSSDETFAMRTSNSLPHVHMRLSIVWRQTNERFSEKLVHFVPIFCYNYLLTRHLDFNNAF
jgi:hypothetical protein